LGNDNTAFPGAELGLGVGLDLVQQYGFIEHQGVAVRVTTDEPPAKAGVLWLLEDGDPCAAKEA
jgi:hypothetical protein